MEEPESALPLPVDGALDLHTFRPEDVAEVVNEYLAECRRRGFARVRIIHGKGRGQLRRTVEAVLARHPDVAEFHLAGSASGGWGATMVHFKA